jgi:hypothetical protein
MMMRHKRLGCSWCLFCGDVQMERQEEFNRLWRFTKKYMQHKDGPWKGRLGRMALGCSGIGERSEADWGSDWPLRFEAGPSSMLHHGVSLTCSICVSFPCCCRHDRVEGGPGR